MKKQVHFGSPNTAHQENGEIMMDLVPSSLWYDHQFMQDNIQRLTDNNGNDNDGDAGYSCLSENSRKRRRNHMRSILSMQAEQWNEMGVQDATGLRSFATALSKPDVKLARERATEGANEAFQIYAQSTEWMTGITAKDYVRPTRVGLLGRGGGSNGPNKMVNKERTESLRHNINDAALRIVC